MRCILHPDDCWRRYHTYEGGIVVNTTDVLDTRTGHKYEDGAFQVCIPTKGKRTFKGETAQNDAERFAEDAQRAVQRARFTS